MPSCLWCHQEFENPPTAFLYTDKGDKLPTKRFCSDAHRAAHRRAEKATATAELVQALEPYVMKRGRHIFESLVENLKERINERVGSN